MLWQLVMFNEWTTGDWKIELKQKKEEIDPSKVTDPYLYTKLVRDEIISGEEQLDKIPKSILVGVNYGGPPVARGPPAPPSAGPPAPPLVVIPRAGPPPAAPGGPPPPSTGRSSCCNLFHNFN